MRALLSSFFALLAGGIIAALGVVIAHCLQGGIMQPSGPVHAVLLWALAAFLIIGGALVGIVAALCQPR